MRPSRDYRTARLNWRASRFSAAVIDLGFGSLTSGVRRTSYLSSTAPSSASRIAFFEKNFSQR
jgi:hypothetical protein